MAPPGPLPGMDGRFRHPHHNATSAVPTDAAQGVPSGPVTPWHSRRPSGALLSLLIVALVGSLSSGCVAVTSRGGDPDGTIQAARQVPEAPGAAGRTAGVGTSPASADDAGGVPSDPSPDAQTPTPQATVADDFAGRVGGSAMPEASARVALAAGAPWTPPPTLVGTPPTGEPSTAISTPSMAPPASPTPMASEPALSAGPSTPPDDASGLLDEATQRRLQAILERTTDKQRVAGLQAAVLLPDGQMWQGQAGRAAFSPVERPVEADTVFAIASVTKTFIAALILQLAEEGRLDLDVPFGRYFTDAPRKDSATIRQLLSHTSGIYNYFEHPRYISISRAWLRSTPVGGLASRDHAWTYDEIMGLVKTGYCPPGKCYHYSNTNYVILGRIAEAVGGAPLHKQLRKRFFRPLGLEDTYYQPAEVPPAGFAHGHWDLGTGYSDHTRDASVLPFLGALTVADAAGAIASTARDLAVWSQALYGGAILSPASLAAMTTILEPGLYGLGTDVASFAGHRAYGHRGGLRGFESSMWYFPAAGVSIVLLSNQGNWLTDGPMERLATTVLARRR